MYKTIIIEDDPMVAAINRNYMEKNPEFQIVGNFANGQEALDYLSENPVDLAIVDYYMPVMDGLHFLRVCREREFSLDVIMITAVNNANQISEIIRLGVTDYLVKPFTYERFQQALQKFLSFRTTFQKERQLSQPELDKILASGPPGDRPSSNLLDKGLQQKTLELIRGFLAEQAEGFLSSEEIARQVKLSRITVRRYMNYLLEINEIESQIDYSTGGRPSIKYRLR